METSFFKMFCMVVACLAGGSGSICAGPALELGGGIVGASIFGGLAGMYVGRASKLKREKAALMQQIFASRSGPTKKKARRLGVLSKKLKSVRRMIIVMASLAGVVGLIGGARGLMLLHKEGQLWPAKLTRNVIRPTTPLENRALLAQRSQAARGSGANVNKENREGLTLLHEAVKEGNIDKVRALITQGADVNKAARGGKFPLHFAVEVGSLPIAEALLDAGANPDERSEGAILVPRGYAIMQRQKTIAKRFAKCSKK